MNALLIYPQFPDTFWSFKHALRLARKKASSPPLGLLTVAALLPPDWSKRLLDLNVTSLTDADLQWADMVLLSAMLVQREDVRRVIARCKAAGVRIVAGGPLFTSEYDQFPEVDHFLLNEAELTIPPFLADDARGRARRVYASADFADIKSSPRPLWELSDMRRYAAMSLQYSRGCPFQCEFCNVSTLFGQQPRTKDAAQVLGELDRLYELGWRGSVFFVDDNFIGHKKHLKSVLLPALMAWQRTKGGLSFYTEASIDLADDEQLVAMMVDAGFDTVFVGIETPNEASLAESGKGQNRSRNLLADIKKLHNAGLQVQGGFIVGFDNDAATIFQEQIDFIQNSGIVTAMVGQLQALPGTRLYERLRRENRLLASSTGDNVSASTNILPLMGLAVLREGYKDILRTIYAPENYYRRVMTYLRDVRPPKVRATLDLDYKMALFRAMFRLGIVGRERYYFWKTLLWSLLTRPKLFRQAVKLAIYGYHFRIISERQLCD